MFVVICYTEKDPHPITGWEWSPQKLIFAHSRADAEAFANAWEKMRKSEYPHSGIMTEVWQPPNGATLTGFTPDPEDE